MFHGANASKRGITLDLTTPEGRDAVLRGSSRGADVADRELLAAVMEQLRARLGRGARGEPARRHGAHARVRARRALARPHRLRADHGADHRAWRGSPGWRRRPAVLPRGPCDPLAGMHAVFARCSRSRERDRTGDGHARRGRPWSRPRSTPPPSRSSSTAPAAPCSAATATAARSPRRRASTRAPATSEWLALAVATDEQWDASARRHGRPGLGARPRARHHAGRRAAHDRIDDGARRVVRRP